MSVALCLAHGINPQHKFLNIVHGFLMTVRDYDGPNCVSLTCP